MEGPFPVDHLAEENLPDFAGKTVFIRSFGCTLNLADSLRIEAVIRQKGGIITGEADAAEAVVVNTCTVVNRTEHEVLRFLRQHANKELYVLGCMATLQEKVIRSVCHPVFLPSSLLEASTTLGVRLNGVIGVIPIARGCRGRCTYCMARRARGTLHSETCGDICRAVSDLMAQGVREIQLTAQDVSSWGLDRGQTLPHLLERIITLPGNYRLRLGMMNPTTLIPLVNQLLPLLESEKMYAFAHLPLQSGSNLVLRAMGRGYTTQEFLDVIRLLRDHIPDIWVATDVIVGFPKETEEDFQKTVHLIERVRPNKVNITRYSARPGTPAALRPDILERTKKERSRKMSLLAELICKENNQSWIDRVVQMVVVERIKPGSVVGRTSHYRSVVMREDLPLGTEGYARITGAKIHYFTGSCISK
ncbi:MAG: MiaB/RimO family radical SAM methylthiotransferase [Methanomicrobiales archaeon]|nr:MiaB/RimO family radical SAM methylthiotransferase [Methanomicrobiales archaeon]MDD1679572.1 MiaB/RimO family radical SAM methylthiotransferase [Methanomicrobiales archaeon]